MAAASSGNLRIPSAPSTGSKSSLSPSQSLPSQRGHAQGTIRTIITSPRSYCFSRPFFRLHADALVKHGLWTNPLHLPMMVNRLHLEGHQMHVCPMYIHTNHQPTVDLNMDPAGGLLHGQGRAILLSKLPRRTRVYLES